MDKTTACQYQAKNLMLQAWKRLLTEQAVVLQAKFMSKDSLRYQLAMTHLFVNVKQAFYISFYRDLEANNDVVLQVLYQTCQSSFLENTSTCAEGVIEYLKQSSRHLQGAILDQTRSLVEPSDLSVTLAVPLMRLLSENSYYRTALAYFNACEEASQTAVGQRIPILNTRLSNTYLTAFSGLLASLMLGIDLYTIRWFGLSHITLNCLTDFILMDIDTLLKLSYILQIDERRLLINLPTLRWAFNLIFFLGINFAYYGINRDFTQFLVGGYLLATGSQALVNYLLEPKNQTTSLEKTSLPFLVKGIISYIAFLSGSWLWRQLYPSLPILFKAEPTKEELLTDPQKCLAHKEICRKHALQTMQLTENATASDVKKSWRAFNSKHHPDKSKSIDVISRDAFYTINNARKRLLELFAQETNGLHLKNLDNENRPIILRLAK